MAAVILSFIHDEKSKIGYAEIEDWLHRMQSISMKSMQSISTESKDGSTIPRYVMSGFYIEKGGFLYAAAIDARHRAGQSRYDMVAEPQ